MRPLLAALIAVMVVSGACGGNEPEPSAETGAPSFPPAISPYEPDINPADFVAAIDNPYLPLEPGTTYVYEGTSQDETEKDTVFVTRRTKEVLGVTCTVVRDVVTVGGEVAEKTFDWYAQDRFGNVWYFGENSKEFEDGKFVSTAGSWQAGVDGAQPGLVMLGNPRPGDRYRQEFYEGEAEDFGRVLELDASVEVPSGSYDAVLVTQDSTPLEPKILEQKYYARGVGLVLERHVEGPREEFRLVNVKRG